jgi:flavin reductase (DIM6/NTAB) family NADH-FMN oxidoreductase RutF
MTRLESPPSHEIVPGMSAADVDAQGFNFRVAMRELASGVAIVTCGEGDRRAGCTATSLASLSLTPPSLIVCLDRTTSTLARLREVGAFAVNLLAAHHAPLAARFAGRDGVKGAARFERGDWLSLVTGAPVLADALASIDCRVEDIVERHSHAIIIGVVQAVRSDNTASALLHWRSRFEPLE